MSARGRKQTLNEVAAMRGKMERKCRRGVRRWEMYRGNPPWQFHLIPPNSKNLWKARSRLGRGRLFKVDTHFTAVSRSTRFDQILKLLHRSVCRKLSECYESSSVVVFVCAKVIGVALNV